MMLTLSCGDQVRPPTSAQLAAFEEAGAVEPLADMDRIRKARLHTGPYRVVPGDVLEFTMPSLLQSVTTAELRNAKEQTSDSHPYICRVSTQGTITLPAVPEMQVSGRSLAEIEDGVIRAYQKYVILRPSVFVRVMEYKTCQVALMGAVTKPGVYALRDDQMSLVALLMEAEGITKDGAAMVRIVRLDPGEESSGERSLDKAQSPDDGLAAQPNAAPPRIRVTFLHEGALNASGWVTVTDDGQLVARQWLDLGSELQRRTFLEAVAGTSSFIVTEELRIRLSELARHLEASELDAAAGLKHAGWEAVKENQWATAVHKPLVYGIEHPPTEPVVGQDGAANTLVLPIKGWNIPFRDVALKEGDTVIVEKMQMPLFSVLGLVNKPGNFEYPPTAQYTLAQAIGFAEGLDAIAEPRYATIYRLTRDNVITRVPLRLVLDGEFTEALKTPIRPGDVVAIENTPRTQANKMINNLLRINTGLYLSGSDIWK
jgi:protein involved in polysaccharide export with SLBB domain